jgi:disulfide bond formation protein DsbB
LPGAARARLIKPRRTKEAPISVPATRAVPATRSPLFLAAFAIAITSAATILGAYFFQYVMGLPPCPLCLQQRIPYYIAIPFGLVLAAAALRGARPSLIRGGLATLAIVLLLGVALGAYHAGVEWKMWAGPTDCTGPINDFGSTGSLLQQMQTTSVVRCDEAAWRFLGLSLAGYNVLISAVLAGLAIGAVAINLRQEKI